MSTHQRMFVLVSFFVLLRSVLSDYQDNSNEADNDQEDERTLDNLWRLKSLLKSRELDPDSLRDFFMRNDPNLFYSTSMNRKRNKLVRLRANKKNMLNNNMKDDMREIPGKSSLSIISPLEALQRKVAVVYNIRQKERNRGLLNNYGKRSPALTYVQSQLFSEPNEPSVLKQSDSNKLNQYEGRLYDLYRIP